MTITMKLLRIAISGRLAVIAGNACLFHVIYLSL